MILECLEHQDILMQEEVGKENKHPNINPHCTTTLHDHHHHNHHNHHNPNHDEHNRGGHNQNDDDDDDDVTTTTAIRRIRRTYKVEDPITSLGVCIHDPFVGSPQVQCYVSDGSTDFYGHPSRKNVSGNWRACMLIFGCEVCERVAYYAISSNLVIYLTTQLHEDVADSARNVNNWAGTTFLTPLIGAFIADSYLGRFWTLATFLCGYLLAVVLVTLAVSVPSLKPPRCERLGNESVVCPSATPMQVGFFYFALYLMALGAGGIKANVCAFAGDQFDVGDVQESKRKMSFPNWWFVSISFGTMLSVSILVYIQDNVGWYWAYGATAMVTAIGTAFFFFGMPLYRHQIPTGSPLTRVAQVIVASLRKWNVSLPSKEELLYEITNDDVVDMPPPLSPTHIQRKLPHSNEFVFLDKAAVAIGAQDGKVDRNPWLLCTVTQVEEVKLLIRMLPIWVTNLVFSTVFAQVGTFFLRQGATMDRSMGQHFKMPAASFALFITLTICILLPLYDRFFVSFARRFTGNERGLTILQRIGVGQVISTLSMVVAACVEHKRLVVAQAQGLEENPLGIIPMTIFWLLPQYVLVGVSEVFISVGQLDFFYDQAPDSMRSVGAALYLSSISVGSFMSSLLITIVSQTTPWLENNMNKSHVDYFYWLLTIVSSLNVILYLACAKWYTYKVTDPSQELIPHTGSSDSSSSEGSTSISSCMNPLTSHALAYSEIQPDIERGFPHPPPI